MQKAAAERALRQSERLDWCIVRPGLLLKEQTQGGVILGGEDRWTGVDAERDRGTLGGPVKCASPFLASSGAVCAATRGQVAAVCVEALRGDPRIFSRRIVEVVARPEVPLDGFQLDAEMWDVRREAPPPAAGRPRPGADDRAR